MNDKGHWSGMLDAVIGNTSQAMQMDFSRQVKYIKYTLSNEIMHVGIVWLLLQSILFPI